MKTLTPEELQTILDQHAKWLSGEDISEAAAWAAANRDLDLIALAERAVREGL